MRLRCSSYCGSRKRHGGDGEGGGVWVAAIFYFSANFTSLPDQTTPPEAKNFIETLATTMQTDPFQLFSEWYSDALQQTTGLIPSACCFSTIGLDGFPNARFVSLKEVSAATFIITGPLNSRKGREVDACNKVALTFWWEATQRQVRIQGNALRLPTEAADDCFNERSTDAKIVSVISRQGEVLQDAIALAAQFEVYKKEHSGAGIARPADWGGFAVHPLRMEFMQFRQNRLHERILFQQEGEEWKETRLQP